MRYIDILGTKSAKLHDNQIFMPLKDYMNNQWQTRKEYLQIYVTTFYHEAGEGQNIKVGKMFQWAFSKEDI